MSPFEPARRAIRFDEFRQVVRRFPPSALLPRLAEIACAMDGPPYDLAKLRYRAPWALALIARESVLWGNEHRTTGVSDANLVPLFNAHNNLYEGSAASPEGRSAHAILTRVAYEQFPYQESVFEELTRTHALLVDGLNQVQSEVLDANAWTRVLGAPLPQVVGATFFLQVAAEHNNGWFDPAWLDRKDFPTEIFQAWPREVILQRVQRLSTTFEEFRAAYHEVPSPQPGYERYAFNPLTSRPFLRWHDGRFLAPQPRLILRTVSPGSLYYAGIAELGTAFARDLGRLTENYVGEHLATIDGAQVHPEVVYGRSAVRSTDWFLVLPSFVVMFEVKSARFGLLDRAADPGFEDRIRAVLARAVTQLERSDAALRGGLPEFAHIPADRPRIGIVVTAEPYYLANSPMVRSLLPQPPTLPILTASLRELEHLVELPAGAIAQQLASIVADPERFTWSLSSAIRTPGVRVRNPVLRRAWDTYPWPFPEEDSEVDE